MKNPNSKQAHPASFRDRSGFVFLQEGQVFRQVNYGYASQYSTLIESGLYSKLVHLNLLIPHKEVDIPPAQNTDTYKILKPDPIDFISYPYEWSFSQLKDAALTTLEIQKLALDFGMSLKDASAFNIQFHHGHPILIDTLSFEILNETEPWVAYRQFCQHFLAPLALISYLDIRLGKLLATNIDGLPLDFASRLLPARSYMNLGILTNLHVHALGQRTFTSAQKEEQAARRKMTIRAHRGLINELQHCVRKLSWMPKKKNWANYYSESIRYKDSSFSHKMAIVNSYLDRVNPSVVWDLGANTGVFSRLSSQRGLLTISLDNDPYAVEANYLESKREGDRYLLPLLIDLNNPSPAIGWKNEERDSLLRRGPVDLAMALALIHHLAISNNVPVRDLAIFFSDICRWLIIEFIPKQDEQVLRLLSFREDIFDDYSQEQFEDSFENHFKIIDKTEIIDSGRILYLMKTKTI